MLISSFSILSSLAGRPTLKQCEKVRKKREEAAEVAELNTENVITGFPFIYNLF